MPASSNNSNNCSDKSVVVIVDPYSTGGSVSVEFAKRGKPIIALWTDDCSDENRYHVPAETAAAKDLYLAELMQEGEMELEALASKLRALAEPSFISSVVCGGETGVKVADALSEYMGCRSNGTDGGAMKDRRDKSIQQNAVRASGLRACREACGHVWEEVAAFASSEPLPIVVKPVESAGSDGVKLCHTLEDVKAHFELLMRSQRKVGASGAAVLLQEFLKGKEYVVDHVTCDGVHKTTMVWVYDKRAANGSAFVYFNMVPVPSDSDLARSLIEYTRGCLDAIKVTNGATHSEIMMTADGPCLVEVNCRCHGGNGAWLPLASRLTGGVTQVGALVDAFTDADAFANLPDVPPSPFLAGGSNPMFCSYHEGKILSRPGYDKIRELRSFHMLDESYLVGDTLERSVDLFTSCGQCILIHDDPAVVAEDEATIRAMELDGSFFTLEPVRMDSPLCKAERSMTAAAAPACLSELSEASMNASHWRTERAAASAA